MPETRRRPQGMYGMEADEVRFILRSLGLSDVANAHGFPVGGIQEFYGLRRYRVERGSGIAGRGTLWALVEIGSGERIGPRCSKPTELKRLLTEWMAGPKPNHPGRSDKRLSTCISDYSGSYQTVFRR